MTKCSNCKSVELVTVGGLVLLGTELFCDVIQCATCLVVFAAVRRQVVIKITDEEEPDIPLLKRPSDDEEPPGEFLSKLLKEVKDAIGD